MGTPRMQPGRRADVGFRVWAFAQAAGVAMGTEPPKLFLLLGRNRRVFWRWLRFAAGLMPRGTLPRRESELVILRVAHLEGSACEWSHHERIGAAAGVTPTDLDKLRTGPSDARWSARERALLTVVDELHQDGDLSDATWATLREELDEAGCVEVLLLYGHYRMLAETFRVLRVAPDRPLRMPPWLDRVSSRVAGFRSSR